MKTPSQQFHNRDIYLSATIWAITGQQPATELERGVVVFVHDVTPELNAAVAAHLSNSKIPVQDFVAAYKKLRTQMYATRG